METEITGGEFGLIERIKRLIDAGVGDAADVVLGIGDDAAIVLPPPGKLLSACDMLVEGVHFKRIHKPSKPWLEGTCSEYQ